MASKKNLGEIRFATEVDGNLRLTHHIGQDRVDLLRKARALEPFPDGLILVGQRGGGGYEKIGHGDIDWDQFDFYEKRRR